MRTATAPRVRAAALPRRLAAAALPVLCLLVLPGRAGGQDAPPDSAGGAVGPAAGEGPAPLVTDRPDFTESTASVAPGRVQLESGYTLSRQDAVDGHAVGEVLVRVGVASPLEARLAPGSYTVIDGPDVSASGLGNPALGAKATLLEPDPSAPDAVPSVALLASTTLPAGHDEVSADGAEPTAALALGWSPAPRLSVGANLRHARLLDDGRRFGRTVGSLALGVDVAPALAAYGEVYGLRPAAPEAGDAAVLDGGLTFLLGPDAQLDARAGFGLGKNAPDLILGVGVAWRR